MIVGMDFGTTNSGMSVYDGQRLRLIPLDPANRNPHVVRTALYIANDRSVHIGRDAIDTYYAQNLNRPSKMEMVHVGEIELTFAELPTFIRDVYIEKDIYSPGRLFLSFKMGLSSQNYLGTIVGLQYFFLEDIIATYLYVTRLRAQQFLERELDTIVLGRPVRFSDDPEQNQFAQERLLRAAFLAGYKKVYFQYEPIAAAYFYETTIDTEHNILIFDFGGGTLDLSVLRVGNPKTRRVLANGGIPIAGDIFDQRIVRAKYPPHFGEGSTYRSMNTRLPVPPSFYEAFSDWQTLLTLQGLDSQEKLQQIAQTADHPHKLQALLKLISGQYGLRMYDVAEAAKRQLSDTTTARLDLEGDGFKVFDTITRSEFNRLIRADVRAISERIDEVLEQAGLREHDIDVVIRTGGSARIPVFIDLLEERFGAQTVRDLDAFSSVTSGLGVIGQRIQQGEVELPEYDIETYIGRNSLYPDAKTRVPEVDLQVLQRVIEVQEHGGITQAEMGNRVLLGLDNNLKIFGKRMESLSDEITLDEINLCNAPDSFLYALSADEEVLLLTTDFTVLRRPAGEIADLRAVGLHVEALEGFRADQFSTEYIYSIVPWSHIEDAEAIVTITSLGYAQKYIGEKLLEKLAMPVPYQMPESRGYLTNLTALNSEQDYMIVSQAGRIIRLHEQQLSYREQRVLPVSLKSRIISAFAARASDEVIFATASGYAGRRQISRFPYAEAKNDTGEKLTNRSNPVAALPYRANTQYWAMTNKRLLPIAATAIPLQKDEATDHKLFSLRKGEKLITLFAMPQKQTSASNRIRPFS